MVGFKVNVDRRDMCSRIRPTAFGHFTINHRIFQICSSRAHDSDVLNISAAVGRPLNPPWELMTIPKPTIQNRCNVRHDVHWAQATRGLLYSGQDQSEILAKTKNAI